MVQAEILGITQVQGAGFPTVLLRHEERVLLISIGLPEASAIQLALLEEKPPRPMTHDLICNILAGLRGNVLSVNIYKLEEQTFFAYLSIEQTNEQGEVEQLLRVDARPSDGIAIALRVGCPIYVEEAVLDEAGHDAAMLRPLFEEASEEGDDEYEDGDMDDEDEN
ncbi:MAG TPA: bifunctional nuclease family protein [Candidatus Hydrogenedentes bacterium]|nr:bifunctional nuclease family protein [Candidatus Hydrogenedentota bacterium]